MLLDPQGRPYYANVSTRRTQWEYPTAPGHTAALQARADPPEVGQVMAVCNVDRATAIGALEASGNDLEMAIDFVVGASASRAPPHGMTQPEMEMHLEEPPRSCNHSHKQHQ